jgi:hypothetical protein
MELPNLGYGIIGKPVSYLYGVPKRIFRDALKTETTVQGPQSVLSHGAGDGS